MTRGFFFRPNFLSVNASWAVARKLARERLGDKLGSGGGPSWVCADVRPWFPTGISICWSERCWCAEGDGGLTVNTRGAEGFLLGLLALERRGPGAFVRRGSEKF